MEQKDTVERILHAAAVLFAERGFSETSLRTITGVAEVNLAAVNYHFGSKKELIKAVFFRFLTAYCRQLDAHLDKVELNMVAGEPVSAEILIGCMLNSLLVSTKEIDEKPQTFMRLLSLSYTQSQDHLRHFLKGSFATSYSRFVELVKKVCPKLDAVEFYWRLYFVMGASIFTLSNFDSIRSTLKADYQEDSSMRSTIDMMIPSLARMLTSPTNVSVRER